MKAVVQRVSSAAVSVDGNVVGSIEKGLLVLLGITHSDTQAECDWMADKLLSLRIFPDADGKMNLDVQSVEGGILVVSQFTLYGELKKGTRPSFIDAARPEHAEPLYNYLLERLHVQSKNAAIESGVFGAMMEVQLTNDGPVTINLER